MNSYGAGASARDNDEETFGKKFGWTLCQREISCNICVRTQLLCEENAFSLTVLQ